MFLHLTRSIQLLRNPACTLELLPATQQSNAAPASRCVLPSVAKIDPRSDMGSSQSRSSPLTQSNPDEVGARELGLKNDLKLAEVNTLIDYYKRKDPANRGLLPEQFKEAAGEFFAAGLTIDPKIIFSIFDTAEGGVTGRVTLREFILGYAILCRGSTEGRLRFLFAIYGSVEGVGFLTREQLINSLRLMRRIVAAVTEPDDEEEEEEEENEKQIRAAADELIEAGSDPENRGISYDDFIEKVKTVDVITLWLEDLSSVAGEHMKYIEKRELALVQLHMEREGLLASASQTVKSLRSGAQWTKEGPTTEAQRAKPPADQKIKIPLPKKYKPVRRDLEKAMSHGQESSNAIQVSEEDETGLSAEVYAAKPFVINYNQIEFGKILGRGACATVYECEWLHVPVAVKVFNDGYGEAAGIEKLATADEELRKNVVGDYVEEFWLLLQIRHPNCLLYMGICFEPYVCIVTELFTGGSVANFLHGPNPRKFAPEQALEMLSGVARGMFYLHASSPSILHRDLKASNILINRTVTHCVICDFGLSSQFVNEASRVNSSPDARRDGQVIGTPYTMAPEVMNGDPYTPAADVYSYGIVMYEMYTGRFPFPGMKPVQLMFYVLSEKGRPKFHDEDDVPPTLKTLIEQCWAQDQFARPTFEDILGVLSSKQLKEEITTRQAMEVDMEGDEGGREQARKSSLSTRLLEAVYRGQVDKAARLIDQGAHVNYADYDKRTALHVAAAEGYTECIRLLLSAGAEISFDRWGNSPLADAASYANRTGDSEPIRILRAVESRVSGFGRGENTIDLDPHHLSLLHKQMALTAAAEGDVVTLKKLLDCGVDANCCDYDRRTPLMVAASEGHQDIVELLIRHGADVERRDRWASTAYHEAERGGFHHIIRLIRQAGGSTEHASAVTRYSSV